MERCYHLAYFNLQELFGSAGALKSAKLLRPGTAEVVFFTAKEAIKAIEMYDQRELDGQWAEIRCLQFLITNSNDL